LRIRSHYVNGPAFGGLAGNVNGFGKFLKDQLQPHSRFLTDSTRELFHTPQRTTDGAPVPMTLGWHVRSIAGMDCFYKEGGGGGFHSLTRIYPTRRMATNHHDQCDSVSLGSALTRWTVCPSV
jgi:hypothetical protein